MALSQAIRIYKNGGPEELRFETIEVSDPGPGQVLLHHTAIGVNFTDIHHRTGRYPGPGFPLVLGMEAVGIVEMIGDGVRELKAGDRVAYAGASPSLSPGSYCQLRVMNAGRLVKIPDWLNDETAAATFLKGLTAEYLLRGSYHVREAETILIHAAAGGVGLLMTQWARYLGATVIGTVSSPEKESLAKDYGCQYTLVSSQEDVVGRVREITDGEGVAVVYDSVGANTFEISLACVRKRGTIVSFGSASGPVPPFDIFRLNRLGSLSLVGAGLADYISDRSEYLERAEDLFHVLKSGVVRAAVHQRYPLADAVSAHRDLEARRTTGSSILIP